MQFTLNEAPLELVDSTGKVLLTIDLVEGEMFLEKIDNEGLSVSQVLEALVDWVKSKSDGIHLSTAQAYGLMHKIRLGYNEYKKKLNQDLGLPVTSGSLPSTQT